MIIPSEKDVQQGSELTKSIDRTFTQNGPLFRLWPTWVPRSFLHPGKRIRLAPGDYYAYGKTRGGIDERWFGSTTDAANEGRVWHEGQSIISDPEGKLFLLRDAIAERGPDIIGPDMWKKYEKWPVYSKFFDNMGPIPHHMHQSFDDAALVDQEGKPESYYFAPQYNNCDNNFPYTFMGLDPDTTPDQVRRCLENWDKGDNGILDLTHAVRLQRGTGWLIPPGVLHAPGSLCTYEPQWGSDVFGMYQSLVEGRDVPWSLLVKDMPEDKHQDLDFIVGQLDWDKNIDPNFKAHNYLEPFMADQGEGWQDDWIVYGRVDGKQLFSARRLTLQPDARVILKDPGASCWTTIQGSGMLENLKIETPTMIAFGSPTKDEVFITYKAAQQGVRFHNTGDGPLVGLRYFGPDVFPADQFPNVGAYKNQ